MSFVGLIDRALLCSLVAAATPRTRLDQVRTLFRSVAALTAVYISSGRSDDNLESILKRFKTFQTESQPVIQKYGASTSPTRVAAHVLFTFVQSGTVCPGWESIRSLWLSDMNGKARFAMFIVISQSPR